MSEQPRTQEIIQAAQTMLENMLRLLEFSDAQIEVTKEDDQITLHITTSEPQQLLGNHAQLLDALQFLLNRMVPRDFEDAPYCVVNCNHHREQRREKLLPDIQAAVEQVRKTGRPWKMPPLQSPERRVIHKALRDMPDIHSYSQNEDVDGRKRVVIALSENFKPAGDSQAPSEPAPE